MEDSINNTAPPPEDTGKASQGTGETPLPGGQPEVQDPKGDKPSKDKSADATPPTLLPQHQKLLDDSSIKERIAVERGYRSVSSKAELRRLGFADYQCNVPGLLIPIRGVTGEIENYQFRPDSPRIGKDGRKIKYETVAGSRMSLDVPPSVRPELGNPKRSLVVTEGARKADAGVTQGLTCVSLLGVWNWRGTNAHGGIAALGDWDAIALKGRMVFICFDSDVMTKPEVHKALVRLKAFLESRGALVQVIYLPAPQDGTKRGLDDFFKQGGDVSRLFQLAIPTLIEPKEERPAPPIVYSAEPGGIYWLKESRDGMVGVPLTNFTALISCDVIQDDGLEVQHVLEIDARVQGRQVVCTVPASQFAGMGWVASNLGPNAHIEAGLGLQDHARCAIQKLSGDVPSRRVYLRTGWQMVNGVWVYLHGAGAIGETEQAGEGIEVRLPGALKPFRLPPPPQGMDLIQAIKATLRILDIAPDRVTVPILGGLFRSVLGKADFYLHAAGKTGAGKTELAALIQAHFGVGFNSRDLPGSWLSTANALEEVAFTAADAMIVIDDFAPDGSAADVQRRHREADRILRAQGNSAGRQRMRSDATLRPAHPPRGTILSTGEDVPHGESLRARAICLELGQEDLDWDKMSAAQRDAAAGTFARCMSGFLRWLAPRLEEIRRQMPAEVARLREQAFRSGMHKRTSDHIAQVAFAFRLFCAFAEEAGAL